MSVKKPIAVVGMAGIFPGASNINFFWENILNKVNAISDIPENRWIVNPDSMYSSEYKPDKTWSKKAGLITDFIFNPDGLSIDIELIKNLDPLYHIILHAARDAFFSSHYSKNQKKRTGVIIASIALPTDASSFISRKILGKSFEKALFKDLPNHNILQNKLHRYKAVAAEVTSLPGAIVAKALGLEGGSFTIDAACSSSIYAVKLACDQLHIHQNDIMIAGGISRAESLYTQVGFTQLQALSPSGVCAPFDKDADGLVVGEGTGLLVLKRIDDAIQDNDHIYGLIYDIGLSNDMGGNLIAPVTNGQVRAMTNAYKSNGWTPYDIDLIECHAAGTPVGDTKELISLKTLWGKLGWSKGQCAIGSVKSMIGHLLTGAGGAGIIKTLMALEHKILPPTINFKQASENSPIHNSPFRVQTQAQEWNSSKEHPRRAAISAFGFGGINGHLLVEERPNNTKQFFVQNSYKNKISNKKAQPIAIVGIGAFLGNSHNVQNFQDIIFKGKSLVGQKNSTRWKGCEEISKFYLDNNDINGNFISCFNIGIGEFHIPPNEIKDILPQQLLMLKTANQAMKDAGLLIRQKRPKMGAAIGIDFDFESTNFNIRWNLINQIQLWMRKYNFDIDPNIWLNHLMDEASTPLTSTRTIGALGSIVASRIGKEFKIGGPCFSVSCKENSGLKALEIGTRSLELNETDIYLVGTIDLNGDVRNIIKNNKIRPFSKKQHISPFSNESDGTVPGEGSVALVLKRLDQAIKDKNTIYSVIKGIGNSTGQWLLEEKQSIEKSKKAYSISLQKSCKNADIDINSIDYIETHGSADPIEDKIETDALTNLFKNRKTPCFIGSVKPNIGNTGASAGLASVVKTSLCLYQQIIPKMAGKNHTVKISDNLIIPETSSYWNPSDKIPRACVSSMTKDGNYTHVILERYKNRTQVNKQNIFKSIIPISEQVIEPKFKQYIEIVPGGQPAQPILPPIKKYQHNSSKQNSISDHNDTIHKNQIIELIDIMNNNISTTAQAHKFFLQFSNNLTQNFSKTFVFQTELLSKLIKGNNYLPKDTLTDAIQTTTYKNSNALKNKPAFDKDMCMEFAIGSIEKVLGPEFSEIDLRKVRVRLPDKPLMLVDRILSVEGKKCSLKSGRIITEHDVKEKAWYLDGGKTPVCISIEAGQADLFLCSYLGIDHVITEDRAYRLLNAIVTFHRGLPEPGDTIRYEIEIKNFIRQQNTYLFFFNFEGYIENSHLITMQDGCAGFFTHDEIKNSGGIILTKEELQPLPGKLTSDWEEFIPFFNTELIETYDEKAVQALRSGDLELCFGHDFSNMILSKSLRIPDGRMKLIDRVLELNPKGGRYGIGLIKAQADIYPDDWFLTCHFIDDMVMPGTLMYECCAHTLRIFTLRMGWVTNKENVCYEPIPGLKSDLRCRGPVTPETKQVTYEIEIKEIGYNPEPYVIADAHMYSDNHKIVFFKDMGIKITNLTHKEIKKLWKKKNNIPFTKQQLLEFALGSPSKAYGKKYEVFDKQRFIARLPNPPYLMIDRITHIKPRPWVLKPDGWIKAELNIDKNAWYFIADRSNSMPISIILETALQPCGWLAAYMGSALKSRKNLKFRNLEGNATLYHEIRNTFKTVKMMARLTKVSETSDMIIESFEMKIIHQDKILYEGSTTFGFFTQESLDMQVGLRDISDIYQPLPKDIKETIYNFDDTVPLFPEDTSIISYNPTAQMPAKALRMIDYIETYLPDSGPFDLGFIRGVKKVDPKEWFFKAHFYQDPVCPGSLGIESFIQLIKFIALKKWPDLIETHHFELLKNNGHKWIYRGQITPTNKKIEIEAFVTTIENKPIPMIQANGFLKVDGLYIYKMENFGIQLVRTEN